MESEENAEGENYSAINKLLSRRVSHIMRLSFCSPFLGLTFVSNITVEENRERHLLFVHLIIITC